MAEEVIAPSKKRIIALDVLRGLTIASMILVNNGGGPEPFLPLEHSKWNGISIADLVFPFFLFMVGISTYISLRKYSFQWSNRVGLKILKRTLLLLVIGWCLYLFHSVCKGDCMLFEHLRMTGVLHRIALCYGIVAVMALLINHKHFIIIITALLVLYTIILFTGNGYCNDHTNILYIVDDKLFGAQHLYTKTPIDPEGIMGMIPSIAHTMLGFIAGSIIFKYKNIQDKVFNLFKFGFILMLIALIIQYGIPFNKRIWSPSYVLMTCGLASSLLALLIYIIDIKEYNRNLGFFLSFGVNPLAMYVFGEFLSIVFSTFGKDYLYHFWDTIIPIVQFKCLAYAISFVMLCWLVSYFLYKRKIYIKL